MSHQTWDWMFSQVERKVGKPKIIFYSENICKNSAMYLSQSKDNHINSKITNSQSKCISPLNLQTVTRTRRQAQLFLRLCDRGSSEWTEGLASTGNSCRSRAPSQKRELGWTRHPTVHEKSFTHKWPSLRHSPDFTRALPRMNLMNSLS